VLLLTVAAPAFGESSAPIPLSSSRIVIDQVEFEGVRGIQAQDLESTLELGVGDRVDRTRVSQSVKNLQMLYGTRGFADVKIQAELKKVKEGSGPLLTALVFRIDEGKPVRISEIRVSLVDLAQGAKNELWPSIERELLSQMDLKLGEIADQERISANQRIMESALVSQEFVGAKLNEIRITDADPPLLEKDPEPASRWIALDFRVELDQRVSFGFRGNNIFSISDLNRMVDEQRLVGLGRDYIDSVRKRIEEQYRNLGYAQVRIEHKTFERPERFERHVTYFIEEGARVEIDSVQFDGNVEFPSGALRSQFERLSSSLIQRGIYIEKEVDAAVDLLVDWIKSKGYLNARLINLTKVYHPDFKKVRVTAYLFEGDQTRIGSIELKGFRWMSQAELLRRLAIKESEPLNLFAFTEGMEEIKALYRAEGYLGARVQNEDDNTVVRYSRRNRTADVRIEFEEGAQYRISRVQIQGLTKTLPQIAVRELRFQEGDVLREERLLESERRLRKLGIFGSVSMSHEDDPEKPGHRIVRAQLSEGTPGRIGAGFGFRNDLGPRVFVESAYTNVWRRNHTISLNANANRRLEDFRFIEAQIRTGYLWPWFLVRELDFRPSFSVERRKYIQFNADSATFSASWDKILVEKLGLGATLTYQLERTRQFNARDEIDNQTLRIGSLIPSVRIDLRDNPLNPSSGFFTTVSFEFASAGLGTQRLPFPISYTRTQFRADGFVPITRRVTWFLSFRTGFEKNLENPIQLDGSNDLRIAIPLIKQFALGGPGSIRGFRVQEINVQDFAIQGTLFYSNYRTQIDLPVAGSLYISPFLDGGNLLKDVTEEKYFDDLRWASGVGLRYATPIGPVNFDWGFKLKPKPGEDPWRFHFTVGIL
jgi:outer membrane protein insertion porin family